MTRFDWTARSRDGRTLRGSREALSEALVLQDLRASGLLALSVRPVAGLQAGTRGLRAWRLLPPRPMDVELGLRQLAVMLRGGLPLLSALRTCAEQAGRRSLAEVWLAVLRDVQSGSSFADALRRHEGFPPVARSLVAVGERTGNLDVVLQRAADAMERRRRRTSTMVTALIYPAIVVTMTFATVAYLTVALIPRLSGFLTSLGRRLPASTQLLVDVSRFMETNATLIAVGFALFVAAIVVAWHSPLRRSVIDPLLLRIPLISSMIRLAGTATLAHNLSLLLSSGVRVTGALEVVEPLLPNHVLRTGVRRARGRVLQGAGLSEALSAERRAFSPLLTSMVAVGEVSGTLDTVLDEVAAFHDARLEALVKRLGTIIEPVIIVIIGALVGFVYLSFFMAIYSIAGK